MAGVWGPDNLLFQQDIRNLESFKNHKKSLGAHCNYRKEQTGLPDQ